MPERKTGVIKTQSMYHESVLVFAQREGYVCVGPRVDLGGSYIPSSSELLGLIKKGVLL